VTSCAFVLLAGRSAAAQAQDALPPLEIYGFVQADAIVDHNQNDPDWYDVSRPSTLPAFANQFGRNGRFYVSPRQSRLGVTGARPTRHGDVQATFEFDLFGLGRDAGQTTINVRHAWGQWRQIGAGQTDSQFADPDVFPNVLDYWGPPGALDFRNTQLFWRPYQSGESNLVIALEQPGASGTAVCWPSASRCRASRPFPGTGLHRPLSSRRAAGICAAGRCSPLHRLRRRARRPVRRERSRLGLGRERELESEGRSQRRVPPASGVRRRHRKLLQRRAR
jgi:hypothetical protein